MRNLLHLNNMTYNAMRLFNYTMLMTNRLPSMLKVVGLRTISIIPKTMMQLEQTRLTSWLAG